MFGLKRRKRVEGWAVDIDQDGDEPVTIRQRLADSNWLWVLSLAAVLVLAWLVMFAARQVGDARAQKSRGPSLWGKGTYDDAEHARFARDFVLDRSHPGTVLDARFTGRRSFRVTVPGDTSADDIDYIAKMAALKIVRQFDLRVVVNVYVRSSDGPEVLTATTRYVPDKYGYVVKFLDRTKRP